MTRLLVRLIVIAAALFAAVYFVPGVDFRGVAEGQTPPLDSLVRLLGVAVIFGLVNAIVRPILKALTCAINFFTFGLFIFVINALMLLLTAAIADRFDLGLVVDGFVPALLGSIVISVVSIVLGIFVPDKDD
jgi:putative membrane protein